jgi:hypothetical protein
MDENAIIEGLGRGDQRAFRELVEREGNSPLCFFPTVPI